MKKKRMLALLLVLIMFCIAFAGCGLSDKMPEAPKVTELWTLQDETAISNPESAWYDEARKCIWVVNTTDSASPNSFISKLSLDGKVLESSFLQKRKLSRIAEQENVVGAVGVSAAESGNVSRAGIIGITVIIYSTEKPLAH